MKDWIIKILTSETIVKTGVTLLVCMLLFGAAVFTGSRYNKGYSRVYLIISRVCIAAAVIVVILWIFGIL